MSYGNTHSCYIKLLNILFFPLKMPWTEWVFFSSKQYKVHQMFLPPAGILDGRQIRRGILRSRRTGFSPCLLSVRLLSNTSNKQRAALPSSASKKQVFLHTCNHSHKPNISSSSWGLSSAGTVNFSSSHSSLTRDGFLCLRPNGHTDGLSQYSCYAFWSLLDCFGLICWVGSRLCFVQASSCTLMFLGNASCKSSFRWYIGVHLLFSLLIAQLNNHMCDSDEISPARHSLKLDAVSVVLKGSTCDWFAA